MIITNKVSASLNIDAICRDFDIYRVTKESNRLDKFNILDDQEGRFKALAVQYQFGRNAFVLFKKDSIRENDFRKTLQDEYEDVSVYHVSYEDLLSQEFCKDNFYTANRLLVQLLMNSIKVPRNDELSYNNLTGKLFYTNNKLKKFDRRTGEVKLLSFLEVKLDPGMFLNLDIKTFRRAYRNEKGRQYVIDPISGNFRKKLESDQDSLTVYVDKAKKDKHASMNYLDISGWENFKNCKLAIMERFLRDVKKQLGQYMEISLREIPDTQAYEVSKKDKADMSINDMGLLLQRRGVVIIDEANSERSREVVDHLKSELLVYYGVEAKEGCLKKDKFNIRVIHSKEYYEELELDDPHNIDLSDYIVQHMVEEENHFKDNQVASPAVNKVVQELLIKEDVLNEKLSLYDWKKLKYDKEWTFVIRNKINKFCDNAHTNLAGKSVWNYYEYKSLKISSDGILSFSRFSDENTLSLVDDEYNIVQTFDEYHRKYNSSEITVEGLVYSDINNIHAIMLTPEKTMPNASAIWDALEQTNGELEVDADILIDAITLFSSIAEYSTKEKVYFADLISRIPNFNHAIKVNDVRKMMGMGKKISKQLNRFLHENYNIWISPEMKDSDFESEYLLDNMLDIKYYEEADYEGTPSLFYFVGTKKASLQTSIHNACAVRKVVSHTGMIEYKELFPLLAVEFVRNKQYTVVPFPFKYLREWR